MRLYAIVLLMLSTCGAVTTAFSPSPLDKRRQGVTTVVMERNEKDVGVMNRRQLFQNAAIVISTNSFLSLLPVLAEVDNIGKDPAHPIVVIGAGGKVRKHQISCRNLHSS